MREMAHEYLVQKWFDGKAGSWQRISANSKSLPSPLLWRSVKGHLVA
jgi:hypothetical protein